MTRLPLFTLLLGILFGRVALATPTVAVLYFQNTGNPALEPLKVGLSQMLITDLTHSSGLKLVERAQLQALLDELKLGHDGAVDPSTASRLGALLGAEYLIMGSYFELFGTLRIDSRVVRVQSGEIVYSTGESAAVAEVLSLEKRLAAALAQGIPHEPAPKETRGTGRVSPTLIKPDPDALNAAIAYSEGLIFLDRNDVQRARESFAQSVQADPNQQLAVAALKALSL